MTLELTEMFIQVVGTSPVIQALAGGIIIALMNLFGASLILVWRDPSERALNGLFGFAAGVMLAAAAFTSLIIPGIEEYSEGTRFRRLSVWGSAHYFSIGRTHWFPTHTIF